MGRARNKYFKSVSFICKSFLGFVAYIAIYPMWLSPLLHKLRGVKIQNAFNVYIAPTVLIDSLFPELVTIEEDVYLTRGVKIISHFNPTDSIKKIIGKETIKGEVVLKHGAFVGVNSIILPNTTIGECSVVAAGAVVTKDVPRFAVVAGNPAKIIGDIRDKKYV
jgi:acetyltransferase-like isoleucine patch superfamily enzyme